MIRSELALFLELKSMEGLLPWAEQHAAAQRFGCSLHEVELTALQNGLLPVRYQRNRNSISLDGQLRLCRSSVAVVGCGGLGGYLLELLARLGVGRLRAIDPDCFEEHNLNRQLLCTMETLGQPKVSAAMSRIAAVNPAVERQSFQVAYAADNSTELLQGVDVVLDALDSIATRRLLAEQCAILQLPLIHGAIAGWYGRLATQLPGGKPLTLGGDYCADEAGGVEQELGNPAFTPALVAALQAAEVCKLLLGEGELLSGHTLWADLLSMEFTLI